MCAYSIYQKPCPACGTVVSTGIKRCDCGYAFGYSDETALLRKHHRSRGANPAA